MPCVTVGVMHTGICLVLPPRWCIDCDVAVVWPTIGSDWVLRATGGRSDQPCACLPVGLCAFLAAP
jgi:hypothetical protein